MISTDRKILNEDSPVRARMIEYGTLFESLDIILFSKRKDNVPDKIFLSGNTVVHPTNSIWKFCYISDALSKGRKILKSMRASHKVITCQDPFETGLVGLILSRSFKVSLHIQIHTDFKSPYFSCGISLNSFRILCALYVLNRVKAIRTVSSRIQNSLNASQRSKSSVLPIFINEEEIKNIEINSDLKKKYGGFTHLCLIASRLTGEKEIGNAIDAFSVANKNGENALVIVGEGPLENALKSKVMKLNIGSKVFFEPWTDRITLISYMKSCDVFLSTSRYEGYGLSMVEAKMSGAKIVATNAGVAPELTDHICPVGNIECIAQAITEAFTSSLEKKYIYPYGTKGEYLEAYKKDIERTLI
jgi:glycosyltransferase involved in cell wall biosynthesis